ncbi:MAG: alpha/beta hydrolase [Bacteroidota bacterium]
MWINVLLGIGIGYVALLLIFYFLQDLFFFRPEKLPMHFRYQYQFPFDEVNFEMEDGGSINGLHFKVPNSKGVVFYFKGNSRSIKGWGKFARDFVSKGYDFFMIDYRGFGKSRGRRTESILYNDAQHVYKWLLRQYDEDKIIAYGRSLGSGIAARIASWNNPRMLILDSPYYSFARQIQRYGWFLPIRWLLKYQIRTDQFIKKVSCPIFIIHGRKDRLISFKHSEMLLQRVPKKIRIFPIDEGGHNNLPSFPEYHEILYDILNDDALYRQMVQQIGALRA